MGAYFQGMGIGAGLIVAIGAQNAFVLSQGVKKEYHWLVAAICAICDAVLIFLGAAGVGGLIAQNQMLQTGAAWGGALFLFWYGLRSFRSAVNPAPLTDSSQSGKQPRIAVVGATLAVTLLNPHVYLDTLVLIGSVSGQLEEKGRFLFAIGAASASIIWFFSLSLGGVVLSPFFRTKKCWQILYVAVGITMWTIAYKIILGS